MLDEVNTSLAGGGSDTPYYSVFEDASAGAAQQLFSASQRYVSVLQSHRQEEEISRKHRSQRRARFVIGLTDSYRKASDESRNRLLLEKASMRSQKEFSMLSQLAEITKWHEVMRANATSRQQVRDQNEIVQRELQATHLETLKEHLTHTADRQREDDCSRWVALVEKRRIDGEHEINTLCRELVQEAVGRAGDVIGYAALHDLPMPITSSIPSVLFEHWQREHLASEEQRLKRLMEDHVSLKLYGYDGPSPHNPAVVAMMCKALLTLRPPAPPTRPTNPLPWPLIFVTGPRYCGKSVVASTVAEHLGMLYFSDQSLVSAAIEEVQQDFTQEDLSDPAKSELVDIGHTIHQVLLEGDGVPVSLMARLIGHCVRNAPHDCAGIIIDGVQMTIETVKAIEAILSGYHDPIDEETLLLAPESANDPSEFASRLSVSRPMTAITEVTATQSREKVKGGTKRKKDEDEPLPPIDIPALYHIAPLNKSERNIVNTFKSRKSVFGTAKIIAIALDADSLFDRVSKVRFDMETGEEYHLDYNPPPDDRLQYLQIRDRPDLDCGNMFAQIESHAAHWNPTARWLQQFEGVQEVIISGALNEMIDTFQNVVMAAAEERRMYCHTVSEAQRILRHREEMQSQQREHNKKRDAMKRQLLAVYMERQVDPLPSVLTEPDWEATQPLEMTSTLAGVLIDTFTDFTSTYSSTVQHTHDVLNTTLMAFHSHNDQCAERFELFWHQEDARQTLLDTFLKKSIISDRNLYVLTTTKEEMHCRIDTLQSELWRLVDARRSEAFGLIDQLCARTTIVESVNEAIRGLGASLVQCELDRFLMVRHLVLTYFSALKDVPIPMDLTDVLPGDVLPQLKGGAASEQLAEQSAPPSGKSVPKKAPLKKGKVMVQMEETERSSDDMLMGVKAKAVQLMEALLDKLTIIAQAPVKSKKGVVEITRAEVGSAGAMATPVVEEEMHVAEIRMQTIIDYFNGIAENVVVVQTSLLYDRLTESSNKHYLAQIAAVNAAVLYLRNRVELETPPQYKLLLGLESFAEDPDEPLTAAAAAVDANVSARTSAAPTPTAALAGLDAESVGSESDIEAIEVEDSDDLTPILSCLTFSRVAKMITLFKVCAPDYRIHKSFFVRIVKQSDYECAGEEVVSVPELFDRFDDWETELIDWRLFIVHLLFWCEPLNATTKAYRKERGEFSTDANNNNNNNSEVNDSNESSQLSDTSSMPFGGPVRRNKFYIEGPDFMSLLELRGDLGDGFVDADTFFNVEHFFGSSIPEEDDDRFRSFCSVLWETFAVDDRLDPQLFSLFLCSDEQPLRGMQKAFGVVVTTSVADDTCALTPDLLDKIFHVFANNPRELGVWDPCSAATQRELFEAVGGNTIQFQDMCGIHAGRVILNNSKCFQRKSFVK